MSNTVELNTCPRCGAPIPPQAPQGLCPKCVLLGAATADPTPLATATSQIPTPAQMAAAFPQLEILELIGRGGMGFVFKARQPQLGRVVALKVLPDQLAKDPRFAERFNREGRVLARLNHPSIVSVFDFGQTGGFYYLLMEYVDGVNLRQAMQAGRFSPSEALALVPKICEALQYAHEQGILHRDIKPENILLDTKGQVKIADFGIAKLVGEDLPNLTLTHTGTALGTPHYMAPEQLEKPADVDHRADIYSLGVVLYELLTGELPIGRFAPPSAKTPVDARVDELVFRALEKEREKRFQSAGEVKDKVENLTRAGLQATTQNTAPSAGTAAPVVSTGGDSKLSGFALAGAALVALSLPVPMLMLVTVLAGRAGIGPVELALGLGSIALPGVGGTLLGCLGLNSIRAGRARGLPLALFATFCWPLLLLVSVSIGLLLFTALPHSAPAPAVAGPAGSEPLRVKFKVPKGQVAVFELCQHEGFNQHQLIPSMSAYVVAPDDEAASGEIRLEPIAVERVTDFKALRWTMSVVDENGGRLGVGSENFGPLRLLPGVQMPLRIIPGATHSSLELPLTPANPDDPADVSRRIQPELALAAGFAPRPPHLSAPDQPLLGSGTNWEAGLTRTHSFDGLRAGAQPSGEPTNAAGPFRFTVTAVAIREDADGSWLGIDYVANVDTNWVILIRAEARGFDAQTRTRWLFEGQPGVQVRSERAEIKLPAHFGGTAAAQLRESLVTALVAQPVEVRPGRDVPLFTFPIGDFGILSASIGARATQTRP